RKEIINQMLGQSYKEKEEHKKKVNELMERLQKRSPLPPSQSPPRAGFLLSEIWRNTMKSIILSMVAATALLSGCADSKTQPVPES
ncbi:hypothetical protein NY772_13295, partial [Escherichia coli]|nr:hypothetical protein [Escherichia coli]